MRPLSSPAKDVSIAASGGQRAVDDPIGVALDVAAVFLVVVDAVKVTAE